MKYLIKHPNSGLILRESPSALELEDLQQIVGGPIELALLTDKFIMYCNEEGKLRSLELNHGLAPLPRGRGSLRGTIVLVGPDEGDLTAPLKDIAKAILDEEAAKAYL